MTNVHLDHKMNLPLSRETHAALAAEARVRGLPATRLARSIIDEWLDQRRRERIGKEIREFAATYAGTELDLDRDLEVASLDEIGRIP